MKKIQQFPITVKKVPGKGWGAFCPKKIPKRTIFNVTTLLVLSTREAQKMSGSSLEPYWYAYGERGRAIALGLGSVMNHSEEPNCSYYFSKRAKTLSFFALDDIPPNQELTHDYGWSTSAYRDFGVMKDTKSLAEKKAVSGKSRRKKSKKRQPKKTKAR